MPDLNQLFDTLVDNVNSGIRAPGAPAAIRQAHQRSRKNAVAAVAAVAIVAVSGGLVAANLGGSEQLSPAEQPTLASPEPTTMTETSEASPGSAESYRAGLRQALAQVPGWAISDNDPTIVHPCDGDWSAGAGGGSGGSISISDAGDPPSVWAENVGFSSDAQASEAATRLIENLESCTDLPWQTQPIAQTGSVLASSMLGVIWVHQQGAGVSMLQVPTPDGPPPLAVQVEVADLVRLEQVGE